MSTKKPKMGRPPLPANKRRDETFEFCLSSAERKELDRACEECDMTLSELIRFRVLGLSERERESIRQRRWVTTNNGKILAD